MNFVPRSVTHKSATNQSIKGGNPKASQKCAESITDNDEVKQFPSQQRWPSLDEPICIVCERYGEYICNETDEDVCSLQCKAEHLKTIKRQNMCCSPIEEVSFDSLYQKQSQYKPPVKSINQDFLREKFSIKIQGSVNAPILVKFQDFNFPSQLADNIKDRGFLTPSPVQMQTIPLGMAGHDLLVSASTSSGKTAAFLLPIIWLVHRCIGSLPSTHHFCKSPIALVIAPTRELCIQIEERCKALSKSLPNFSTALLIGGNPLPPQLHRLKHRIQLVVGTPGRINDILQNHPEHLRLDQIKVVVIDEVDVMLQMGFERQILLVTELLPSKPQFMMFSATIPHKIESMARRMMKNPVLVSVEGQHTSIVKQLVLWVKEASKKKKLFAILNDARHFTPPMLVFVDSKQGADLLCEAISAKLKLKCESIHSDKPQQVRTQIVEEFLLGGYDILVSTNVLGRGIDLYNVRQVLLFDFPSSMEEYIHQVGRAGNSHGPGISIAFINNTNKKLFAELTQLFKACNETLPLEVAYSPQVLSQLAEHRHKSKSLKRKSNNDVGSLNLMEILTESYKKRDTR